MVALYIGWLPALILLVGCAMKGRPIYGLLGALFCWFGIGGLVLVGDAMVYVYGDGAVMAVEAAGVVLQFTDMAVSIAASPKGQGERERERKRRKR